MEKYHRWHKFRNNIISKIIGKDGTHPEFDFDMEAREYEIKNPKPEFSDNCPHDLTHLTIRRYADNSTSVVEQCTGCGKHIKSVSKKSVQNIASLPNFDEEKLDFKFSELSTWYENRSGYIENKRTAFREEVKRKIQSGEITIEDKSTFGSYYSSKEWDRTRKRILKRDNNSCQACGDKAECVHHLTYDRLGKENDLDLISLCNNCHSNLHIYQDKKWFGYRLTPSEIAARVWCK